MRRIGELDRLVRRIRRAQQVQAVLEAHDAHADRTMLQVRVARLGDRVVIDVDHVVEHAHGVADGALRACRGRAPACRRPASHERRGSPSPGCRRRFRVSLVFSVISVHRFEEWTTPTCCCGERMLHGSLNVIHGWPVSNSMVSILRHSCAAGIFLNSLISPRAAFSS